MEGRAIGTGSVAGQYGTTGRAQGHTLCSGAQN